MLDLNNKEDFIQAVRLNDERLYSTFEQRFEGDKLIITRQVDSKSITVLVDLELVDTLKKYTFFICSFTNRPKTKKNDEFIYLQELVFGQKNNEHFVVNHIDHDFYNNKKDNLESTIIWYWESMYGVSPDGFMSDNELNGDFDDEEIE